MAEESWENSDESRWRAVVDRDTDADGRFYYAVKTTGVFCRPGCSARLPRRRNVEFFGSCRDAIKAGYRPCRKCRPDARAKNGAIEQKIIRACRAIEAAEKSIRLKDLAAEADFSPYHFHRLFKKIVGVTPKQYASGQRARRFREDLKTSASVTEAIYSAGFGSNSGPYDRRRDHLSMAPAVYKKGAAGVTITYGMAECFLGWVIVAATEKGVCSIEFDDTPDHLPRQIQNRFPKARLKKAGKDFSTLIQAVVDRIQSPGREGNIPLDIQGTAFQQRVWNILRQIKPGETLSYSEVAAKIGKPRAVRAVAAACAANRIAVVIPCHRVISKDGKLSGYRWGVERKRQLLEVESGKSEDGQS